jgi:putative endonuclease
LEKKVRIEKISPYQLGEAGEEIAFRFLKKKKYRIVEKGFRFFRGEIDIIAYDGPILVFVEVKTRRSHSSGFPEEAVTPKKQEQIKKIALGYCAKKDLLDVESRFDVISLYYDEREGFSISHIKNAF